MELGELLVLISALIAIIAIPLYLCVCIVLISKRSSKYQASFYRIFLIVAVLDISAILNNLIGNVLVAWGVLSSLALSIGPNYGKIYLTLAWWIRVSQEVSSLIVALNRVTAVLSPVRYSYIWASDRMMYVMIFQLASGFPFGIMCLATRAKFVFDWSLAGQKMNSIFEDDDFRTLIFYIAGTLETIAVIGIFVSYLIILYKLIERKNNINRRLSAVMEPSNMSLSSSDSSPSIIAICICGVELTYFVYSIYNVFIVLPTNVFYDLYSLITNLYGSTNCFLILGFSKSIREDVKSVLLSAVKLFYLKKKQDSSSFTFNKSVSPT